MRRSIEKLSNEETTSKASYMGFEMVNTENIRKLENYFERLSEIHGEETRDVSFESKPGRDETASR